MLVTCLTDSSSMAVRRRSDRSALYSAGLIPLGCLDPEVWVERGLSLGRADAVVGRPSLLISMV